MIKRTWLQEMVGEIMDSDKLMKSIREMIKKRPHDLDPEDMQLFSAILSIADERDTYKRRLDSVKDLIHRNKKLSVEEEDILAIIEGAFEGEE